MKCLRPWRKRAILLLALCVPALAQTTGPTLQYQDVGANGWSCCLAADSAGNIYSVSIIDNGTPIGPGSSISLTKTGPDHQTQYTFSFPAPGALPTAVAVDAQQNVIIVGVAGSIPGPIDQGSPKFPLVKPLSTSTPTSGVGFVAKVSPAGDRILFSSFLGGSLGSTRAAAVTVDRAGNIYVAGDTSSPDFPVTPGAYQVTEPATWNMTLPRFAFLIEIDATYALAHSTLLGTPEVYCRGSLGGLGGGGCLGIAAGTAPSSIALTSDGSILIGGATSAAMLPISKNAFQTTCKCSANNSTGFVASFMPDLSALNWLTFFGGSGTPIAYVGDGVAAIVPGSDGSILLAGATASPDFPVTSGVFQSKYPLPRHSGETDLFISRLNSTGSTLLSSTYVGGTTNETFTGFQQDTKGNLWLAGVTASSDFPSVPGSLALGTDFVVMLDPSLAHMPFSQMLPKGSGNQAFVLDAAGNQALLGYSGSLLRLSPSGPTGTFVITQANASALAAARVIAPGEVVSFYGINLGPAAGVGATLDSNARLSTSVGGTTVLFDGIPAPLLYASANQVNAIAPFGIAQNRTTSIQLTTSGGTSETLSLPVVPTQPAIVHALPSGPIHPQAIALNQDGTLNSSGNPAPLGSVVSIYAFGTGLYSAALLDGSIAGQNLLSTALPVAVLFGYQGWGVFFVDGNGYMIAQHATDYTLVTPAHPAKPGEWIIAYATNLGPVQFQPATNQPASGSPLSPVITTSPDLALAPNVALSVNIINSPTDLTPETNYIGLTPGLVGVYQVNFRVPDATPAGDRTLDILKIQSCSFPSYCGSFGSITLLTPSARVKLPVGSQ